MEPFFQKDKSLSVNCSHKNTPIKNYLQVNECSVCYSIIDKNIKTKRCQGNNRKKKKEGRKQRPKILFFVCVL
jgi:hypothetical protein